MSNHTSQVTKNNTEWHDCCCNSSYCSFWKELHMRKAMRERLTETMTAWKHEWYNEILTSLNPGGGESMMRFHEVVITNWGRDDDDVRWGWITISCKSSLRVFRFDVTSSHRVCDTQSVFVSKWLTSVILVKTRETQENWGQREKNSSYFLVTSSSSRTKRRKRENSRMN